MSPGNRVYRECAELETSFVRICWGESMSRSSSDVWWGRAAAVCYVLLSLTSLAVAAPVGLGGQLAAQATGSVPAYVPTSAAAFSLVVGAAFLSQAIFSSSSGPATWLPVVPMMVLTSFVLFAALVFMALFLWVGLAIQPRSMPATFARVMGIVACVTPLSAMLAGQVFLLTSRLSRGRAWIVALLTTLCMLVAFAMSSLAGVDRYS